MKPRKKARLLRTTIIKQQLDDLCVTFVMLSNEAQKRYDDKVDENEIDEIYMEMAIVYRKMCNLVENELKQQNPTLVELFETLATAHEIH